MSIQLVKRAVKNFPRACYLRDSAVKHNRRKWLECVALLRQRGIWVLDQPVRRQ